MKKLLKKVARLLKLALLLVWLIEKLLKLIDRYS
jgi:hypothetical protein